MRKLFQILREASARGEDTVLVTIVDSSGSTPRKIGTHMLVNAQGRIYGTVGGGAAENDAIQTAKRVLRDGRCCGETLRMHPNAGKDLALVCGGEITLRFQYLPGGSGLIREMADCIERRWQDGKPCWLIVDLSSDAANSISLCSEEGSLGASVPQEVREKRPAHPRCVEADGRVYYVERVQQPGRVYIFGGGHVAQALVPVLAGVDFRCVVVEDRAEFCAPELFPGAEETRLIPIEELEDRLHIQPSDYICVLTRGHGNDLECEAFALRTPARYIGVIGSRAKIASVNERLKQRGFTDADLARVATPIGLPIGAQTPAEIAISIAAQLIQVRAEG